MLALSSQHVISGPARTLCNPATKPSRKLSVVLKAAYMPSESVPSPEKRTAMNLLLLGAIGLPVKASNLIIIFSHNASYTDLSVMLYILACS